MAQKYQIKKTYTVTKDWSDFKTFNSETDAENFAAALNAEAQNAKDNSEYEVRRLQQELDKTKLDLAKLQAQKEAEDRARTPKENRILWEEGKPVSAKGSPLEL